MLISKGFKSSVQRELDSFYKEVIGGEFNIREVTKGAFTQSRAKLKHEAFIEMNDNVNQTFYDEAPYLVWHGMKLLACDGTRLVLPKHKSIIDEFGETGYGPTADSMKSLATVSMLYDVLNLVTIDAQIAPNKTGERELLTKHLEKINPGELLLLDRGYPSIALLFMLKARDIEFCIRMQEDWWLSVKDFLGSGETDRIVKFELPVKDKALLKNYPELLSQPIECRLVCVSLPNGEKEVLCTSLTQIKKYTHEDLSELYHHRWSIEEGFKLYKARVEIERFSGKTAHAVKQDFFAKVFMMSLCAILAFPIEERVKKESKEEPGRHPKKINRTSAISMLQSITIALFMKNKPKEALLAFDNIVGQTLEIVRPNRKNERKKYRKRLFHMNYKPL